MSEAIEALELLAVHHLGPVSTQERLAFMKYINAVCEQEAIRLLGRKSESPF